LNRKNFAKRTDRSLFGYQPNFGHLWSYTQAKVQTL